MIKSKKNVSVSDTKLGEQKQQPPLDLTFAPQQDYTEKPQLNTTPDFEEDVIFISATKKDYIYPKLMCC